MYIKDTFKTQEQKKQEYYIDYDEENFSFLEEDVFELEEDPNHFYSLEYTENEYADLHQFWIHALDNTEKDIDDQYAPSIQGISDYASIGVCMQEVYACTELSKSQNERLKQQKEKIIIGNKGEHYVYLYEKQRLAGTPYTEMIDKYKADEPRNGYDILSYTRDGEPLYIEVKTTSSDDHKRFYLTPNEYKKAKEMAMKGKQYRLYLVSDINSSYPNLEVLTALDLIGEKVYKKKVELYKFERSHA